MSLIEQSIKQFTGLSAGKRYWFRHTLIMAKGPNGPIQTLFVDVI
jgi:hypothetical protein